MPNDIFYWVFNMSMTAALTGAVVMLIRMIRIIPRRFAVLLWIIPYMRMVLPFGLDQPYSLMSLVTKVTAKSVVVYQPIDNIAFSMMNGIMAADSYFPLTYKADAFKKVFGMASVVWIAVSLSVIALLTVVYFKTISSVRDFVRLTGNIYFSDKVTTPAVYGIIHPKIILPSLCGERDTGFIIMHEEEHIRHCDNLWRVLALIITSLHWFNPLCWVFLKCLLADMELSCDERVTAKLDPDRARNYALSLLEYEQDSTVFASAFGGAKIRTRIENILSFKKLTRFSFAVLSAFIAVIFCVLLTNAE